MTTRRTCHLPATLLSHDIIKAKCHIKLHLQASTQSLLPAHSADLQVQSASAMIQAHCALLEAHGALPQAHSALLQAHCAHPHTFLYKNSPNDAGSINLGGGSPFTYPFVVAVAAIVTHCSSHP